MATAAQKAKLGVFVLVSLAVGLALIFTFATTSPFDDRVRYYVLVPDASGLEVGTAVYVRGVKAGDVAEIGIARGDREQVLLELDLDEDMPIDRGSLAYLEFAGVTGRKEVNIRSESEVADLLPPGSYIPHGETTLDRLPDRAEQLIAQATQLLESTNMLVQTMQLTADQIDPERMDGILASTEQLMTQLASTSKELDTLVRDTREPLRKTVETAHTTMEQMSKLATAADKVIVNLDGAITDLRGVVGNNDSDVRATVRNLRSATRDLKELSRELRRQPRLLLFGGSTADRELP